MLVIGILEITGLGYGQLVSDDIHLVTNDDNIEDAYICRTRRTDTALRTFYRDGVFSLTSFCRDATPGRRITEFIHEKYLCHGCTTQIHTAGYVRFIPIQHLQRHVRYVQYVATGAILCTEVEGIGYRIGDRIGEGMVVGIVFNDTYERVVVRFVVGLTYQRYLQLRIAHGAERAPVALEAVCRSTFLQREGNLQRIDDIDVLTAYLHIPRAGWTSRSGNGVCRTTDAARRRAWGGSAIERTCVADEAEGLIGFPFAVL